jgi:DNA-binding response OmpR family regulator
VDNSETKDTILVIDDSTTNVVLLQAVLNNKGYDIQTAMNVKEAQALMNKKLPQLILLDLLMPKINGFEFLKELKGDLQKKHIPVIIISALTEVENIEKAYELGACEFVKKPVDIQKLLEIVSNILKRQ